MSANPIDWWGWWMEINDENNPNCYSHAMAILANNPPGALPEGFHWHTDLPF